jgi:HK97 gp10 family phage protein
MATNTVNIKIANQQSIVELFEGLEKGVNKTNTWQKFWRLNVKPFIRAAQAKAPESKIGDHTFKFQSGKKTIKKGTLKKSIGYFTTSTRRKALGGYVGPRVKRQFKDEKGGWYGNFVEWGSEVRHFGRMNKYAGKKFMQPAFEQEKHTVLNNSMNDAVKIFEREAKRWAKRTKTHGIWGR